MLRVPEVTGYIVAGIALGPSVLGWLSEDSLVALGILSEVALGLILFSVGSVFEFSLFRRSAWLPRRRIARVGEARRSAHRSPVCGLATTLSSVRHSSSDHLVVGG